MEHILDLALDEIGELSSPVMLVALSGYFDIAHVATDAVEAFAPAEHAITIGEFDPDPFFDFTQARPYIVMEDGERRIEWPQTRVDVVRAAAGDGHDLVVVIGTEPHLCWPTFATTLGAAAQRLGCEAVITVGAMANAVPHTRPPLVKVSTSDMRLATRLGLSPPSYTGPTGVAGVLQVMLADRSIPTISIRVDIAHYVMNTDHPAASLALQQHLARVLGMSEPMANAEDDDDVAAARALHDEVVDNDEQLASYVRMLEREYDRHTDAQIPSADQLGAHFEAFLKEVSGGDDPQTDDGVPEAG